MFIIFDVLLRNVPVLLEDGSREIAIAVSNPYEAASDAHASQGEAANIGGAHLAL
jgi:hypothetical protein